VKSQVYAIVIEKGARNYSAYAPDLPGCIATGKTRRQVEARMRQAIALHVQGLLEDGEAIPVPSTVTATVSMPAAQAIARKRRGAAG